MVYRLMWLFWVSWLGCFGALAQAHAQDQQPSAPKYEVIRPGTLVRWNFWLGDGPAEIFSSNRSLGNRLRIGVDGDFGADYQFIAGATMIDWTSSGEFSTDVGNVSRYGFDLRMGYFFIPDRLFVEYGLYLGEVSGSHILGWEGAIGHGVGLGCRIFSHEKFHLAIEANYQFIGSQTVGTFNPSTQAQGVSTYPRANIYSLSLRAGFDVGGR